MKVTNRGLIIAGIIVLVLVGAAVLGGILLERRVFSEPVGNPDSAIIDSLTARNQALLDSMVEVSERARQAAGIRKIYLDRYDTIYIHTDTSALLSSLRMLGSLQPRNR
jgi:hypothetical protein